MIFMSFSTGSVYCWTLFREDIAAHAPAFSNFILTLCFMLALFFLGMTAAFGGKIVERSVKRASLYTFIFFTLGWLMTGIGVHMGGIGGVVLAVIGFGPVQGIGLGLGYLTPIKTLMMWFNKNKGFAAGVSIAAFGLAGLIGNPLIGVLLANVTVYNAFYILTALYGILCLVSFIIIDRPELNEEELAGKTYQIKEVVLSKKFIFLWVVLFLNIAAGLALMSHEQQIYLMLGLHYIQDRTLIVALCMLTAGGGNLVGRLVCGAMQDRTPKKHMPYYIMTLASIAICIVAFAVIFGAPYWAVAFIAIFIIQFFFGFGFAGLPGILHKSYGMKQLATIQGYILTAWAIAAIAGPLIATGILNIGEQNQYYNPNYPYYPYQRWHEYPTINTINILFIVLAAMFVIQLVFLLLFSRVIKDETPIDGVEQKDTAQESESSLEEANLVSEQVVNEGEMLPGEVCLDTQ